MLMIGAALATISLWSTNSETRVSLLIIGNKMLIQTFTILRTYLVYVMLFRGLNCADASTQKRPLNKEPIVSYQKHGPLQTIFNLLPDEVCVRDVLAYLVIGLNFQIPPPYVLCSYCLFWVSGSKSGFVYFLMMFSGGYT